LGQHTVSPLNGRSPYVSASTTPGGAPKIAGEPVWINVEKFEQSGGRVLRNEDIIRESEVFLRENPQLRARFELWKKAQTTSPTFENEVLLKGPVPAEAIQTRPPGFSPKAAMRLKVGGSVVLAYAIFADAGSFYLAENKARESARIAGGWSVGVPLGAKGAKWGAAYGPWGSLFGGAAAFSVGYWGGSTAAEGLYDYASGIYE
jgi:hypothetical protein